MTPSTLDTSIVPGTFVPESPNQRDCDEYRAAELAVMSPIMPDDHQPFVDRDAVLASKRAARDAAIDKLVNAAQSNGTTADRGFWSMVHDFETAPTTTNRKQLEEIGIVLPSAASPAPSSDAEVASLLKTVIDGLALLNVYLVNTNHLTDAQLLAQLFADILDEETRDVVGADVQEWIDFLYLQSDNESPPPQVCDRDTSLPRPVPEDNACPKTLPVPRIS